MNGNKKPWNYIPNSTNYFDQMSVYRKWPQTFKTTSKQNSNKNPILWENFTHPNEHFERQDIDEWDFKIKREEKKVGVFVPPTKSGGFFDKTMKDFS